MRARGLKFGILSLALGLAASAGAADGTPGTQPAGPTGPDELQQASEIVGKAQSVSARISNMLTEAKAEKPKDMLRIACLSKKARQANAASGAISGRFGKMQSAATPSVRHQEFSVIQVFAQRLTDIESGASQCVGQGSYQASGSSRIITTVRPGVAAMHGTAGSVAAPPPAPPSVGVPPSTAGRTGPPSKVGQPVPGTMSPAS